MCLEIKRSPLAGFVCHTGDGDMGGILRFENTNCRPFVDLFSDLDGENMFMNPIQVSLKWPILFCSPRFEKQHSSP